MTPRAISMPPAKRKSGIPKKGASSRQREIHHGAKPTTNPGTMTKKTAEPTIAETFLITSPCKQALWPRAMAIGPGQLTHEPAYAETDPLPRPYCLSPLQAIIKRAHDHT
jgi:hypothetical protein